MSEPPRTLLFLAFKVIIKNLSALTGEQHTSSRYLVISSLVLLISAFSGSVSTRIAYGLILLCNALF